MSQLKAAALERVGTRAEVYAHALDAVEEKRRDLAEVMVEAKEKGRATQQEIADATAEHEDERLSRQRVKQLIDDFREGKL